MMMLLLFVLPLAATQTSWDPQSWDQTSQSWDPASQSSAKSLDTPSQSWDQASQSWFTPSADRTIDLASLGLDFDDVFNQLLSPNGIVEQFVLSIGLQIMNVGGYVITGLGYAFLVERTAPGAFLDFLKFFEIILTPQVSS